MTLPLRRSPCWRESTPRARARCGRANTRKTVAPRGWRQPLATFARNVIRLLKKTLCGIGGRRVVVGVGAVAADQQQVAARDPALPGQRRRALGDRACPRRRRRRRCAGTAGACGPSSRRRPSTFWAGLALPWSTAPVSSVRRWGKYHSLPSTLVMPAPESMPAQRSIGVIAPAPDQPAGLTLGVELADVRLGGEHQLGGLDVGVEAERRQVGGGTGGLSTRGRERERLRAATARWARPARRSSRRPRTGPAAAPERRRRPATACSWPASRARCARRTR